MEDYESKAIRVWMRSIMQQRDWSANKWGTLAGTSPTNITRFLNGGKFVPSSKTIAKLSSVAGSAPSLSQHAALDIASRSIVLMDQHEKEVGYITVYNINGDVVAYKWPRNTPTFGLETGDLVIVRKQKKFDDNNCVLFFNDEGIGLGKKIEGMNAVYQTIKNRTVRLADVRVIGRVVQIVKNLDD